MTSRGAVSDGCLPPADRPANRPADLADDEPPVGRSDWIHHALVGLNALARLPAAALGLVVVAGALLAGGAWYAALRSCAWSALAGGSVLLAAALDWAWLATLPRRQISFGPVGPPLVALLCVRLGLALAPLAVVPLGAPARSAAIGAATGGAILQGALWCIVAYATRIEPFRLGVTYVEWVTPKLPARKRVRLVQLSDLHVERITRREREMVERVNALDADFILLTGDYLNFSYVGEARAIADAREILGRLHARRGLYAVRGTHQVDPNALLPLLFEGLPICWLRNEHLTVGQDGWQVTLAGASCTRKPEIDVPAVQQALAGVPQDTFTVLLYHTPELVPEARAGGADLYLAGHTHGGQIRLPLFGAVVTATRTGKRYEMGRYDLGEMMLYVSRGLGMEGMAAPRARLLCPPEIVCIDLVGAKAKGER
jgi:predicted MPP superfamily phosphohydrolase